MTLTILAIVIFTLTFIVALAGIVLPMLPGVPIAALGALVAAWMTGFKELSLYPLIIVGLLTAVAIAVDYIAGIIGAQKYGASRSGIWGSIIGSLIGLFFFPPFGFLVGALIGAIGAEMLAGRTLEDAVKSGFGVLVGTFSGMVAKVFITIAIGIVVFPRLF